MGSERVRLKFGVGPRAVCPRAARPLFVLVSLIAPRRARSAGHATLRRGVQVVTMVLGRV